MLRVPAPRKARQVKCIAYPNRLKPRQYSVKDLERIVCKVVTQRQLVPGTPEHQEMMRRIGKCAPCTEESIRVTEGERQAVGAVADLAEFSVGQSIALFAGISALLIAILVFLRGAAAIPLIAVPLAGLGIRTLITRVAAVEGRVAVQQAANNQAIIRIREAANDFLFRRAARF